jgi:tetratricopeptide (TPR) repeat protein
MNNSWSEAMNRPGLRACRRRVVALVALLGLFVVPAFAPAGAAEQRTARPAVAKPVLEAETLLKEKKFKEALQRLHAADVIADKTPYERYIIEGTRAAVDLERSDYAGAATALEAELATGILAPADALVRIEALARLDYQVKNYPGAIAAADRYYRQGGTAPEPRLLMAQAYYLEKRFADAARVIRALLAGDEKDGRRPDENLLLMLLASDAQQHDETGRIATLKALVSDYPKPAYWQDILTAIARRPGFSARFALDLDRLKLATGAMIAPDEFMEAAQLALQEGLPGDAKSFLAKGYEAGILGKGAGAARQQRLVAMADREVKDDLNTLSQDVSDAAVAKSGLGWIKLGDAFASYRQYTKAISAYEAGIKKGGLDHPGDATLHLGVALLRSGERARAKQTLDVVAGKDGARELASLWLIESGAR